MITTRKLSKESKELIKKSREVALDLGDDFVSTIHFFLADCRLNKPSSLKYFAFDEDDDFKKYYETYRNNNPVLLTPDDDLLFTKEAETTLHNSALQAYIFEEQEIQPYHIFIAALKIPETFLSEIFLQEENVLDKLISYYQESGLLDTSKKQSLFKQLIEKFPLKHFKLIRFEID